MWPEQFLKIKYLTQAYHLSTNVATTVFLNYLTHYLHAQLTHWPVGLVRSYIHSGGVSVTVSALMSFRS